jgi:Fur family ferric uptake transcriptional regulator
MDNCPMEKFTPRLDDGDFRVTGHKVEVYGYCKDCGAERP